MKTYKLRKHQKKQNKLTKKALVKHDHVLFSAPTGFGKSLCILDMVVKNISLGNRVLVIAPYRKLVFQLMETVGYLDTSLLMGSDSFGDVSDSSVVVASLSTLHKRLELDANLLGDIDLILVDETHLGFNMVEGGITAKVKPLYDRYWDKCKWVGFTATPIKANGYRLEGWDLTIGEYSTAWLIKKGWLAKFVYHSIKTVDATNLKVDSRSGEYLTSDMEKLTNTATAIDDVYTNFVRFGESKKTLIFASSIEHATLLTEKFVSCGVSVRVIHSNIPESEQKRILTEYSTNVFNVLINVAMLTTGFDEPSVENLIIARPIGSVRLAIQVWGRVLRVHKKLDSVNIIDLCGVWEKCGLPDDSRDWNKVKRERGDNEDDTSVDITEVLCECADCSEVSRMIDCKRTVTHQTSDAVLTVWYCPSCKNGIVKETLTELQKVEEIQEIKTVSSVDMSLSYTGEEIMQMLGELIKSNTRAKTSWGIFVHRRCMKKDKSAYRKVIYCYAQGIFSSYQTWKRIMDIYGAKA